MSEARERVERLVKARMGSARVEARHRKSDFERECAGSTVSGVKLNDLRELLAESDRLRSLVDEAGKVVERCQGVLAIMVKPDMTVSSMDAWTQCVEAETRSRSLINKLKGEA